MVSSQSNNIAAIQWQANVLHIKGQLAISNALVQLKNANIEALQLSNYRYKEQLLTKPVTKEADKEEEVIKGIVSLKKLEVKGVSINLAEILRRLK